MVLDPTSKVFMNSENRVFSYPILGIDLGKIASILNVNIGLYMLVLWFILFISCYELFLSLYYALLCQLHR